jgi:hypothetical protein
MPVVFVRHASCRDTGEDGDAMIEENTTVSVFSNSIEIPPAVSKLAEAGFDMKRLSVVGRACRGNGKLAAYFRDGDRIRCWGEQSELWNSLYPVIQEWTLLNCPGTGLLLVVGLMAQWIVAVLNNSAIFGTLSVLGATLYSMGVAKDCVQDYEEALRKGNCLLVIHGTAQEIAKAKGILQSTTEAYSNRKEI